MSEPTSGLHRSEWRATTLGALCTLRAGSGFEKDKQGLTRGDLPFIKVSDMNSPLNARRIHVANNWVSRDVASAMRARPHQPDTVVFAKIGEALKSNRFRSLTVPTIIDNNMMGAEPSPGTDATFLYYLLVTANLPAIAEGSALPYLRAGDVARLPVVVPTLPEQQAIAEVLGALDDKIDANRNVAVRAEALAIRLPELVEETTSLGAVAHSDQKTVATSYFAGKEVEHFSLPAFDAGRLPIVESGDEIKSGKCLLEGPTVLVSKLNPHIPRVWMATLGGALPAVTSTEFLGLTPATDYPTEVLWALCASDGFRSQLLEMVKGTTGSHQRVSREDILALQIPDPEAMDRGAWETIAALVCLADGLRREAARLASLRDTLLPRLLSGEQRLRVAQDLVQEAV